VLDKYELQPGAYAFAHWKNVAILVWCTRADADSARQATGFADQLVAKYRHFSVLHIVEDTAGLPTAEGRDALIAVARKHNQHLACAGLLLPRSSILASLLRAFARTMRTLLRNEIEVLIEQDVLELASSVALVHSGRTGVRVTQQELANAVAHTRKLVVPELRTATP
jgi:hypothetical protein